MKKASKVLVSIAVVWIVSLTLIVGMLYIFSETDKSESEITKKAPWNQKEPRIKDQRIVPLIPSSTELVCAIGAERYLVAVSDYCNYPPEVVNKLPRIGDQNLNIEKIVSLRPTIVLDTNNIHKRYSALFKRLGLNYVNLNIETQKDLPQAATILAAHLGDSTLSRRFIQDWNKKVQEFKSYKKSNILKPKIYVEIWNNPLQACGSKNNIHNIVTSAGGINVFSDIEDFPTVNSEMVIETNPDIILLIYPEASMESVKARPGWQNIKAIKNNAVFCIDQDIVVRPSLRNLEAIKQINEIINKVNKDEKK